MNSAHENMLNAHHLQRRFLQMIGVLAFLFLIPELAQAQTAMPWDNFTCMLENCKTRHQNAMNR